MWYRLLPVLLLLLPVQSAFGSFHLPHFLVLHRFSLPAALVLLQMQRYYAVLYTNFLQSEKVHFLPYTLQSVRYNRLGLLPASKSPDNLKCFPQ